MSCIFSVCRISTPLPNFSSLNLRGKIPHADFYSWNYSFCQFLTILLCLRNNGWIQTTYRNHNNQESSHQDHWDQGWSGRIRLKRSFTSYRHIQIYPCSSPFLSSSAPLFRWSTSRPRTTMTWTNNVLVFTKPPTKSNKKKHISLGLQASKQTSNTQKANSLEKCLCMWWSSKPVSWHRLYFASLAAASILSQLFRHNNEVSTTQQFSLRPTKIYLCNQSSIFDQYSMHLPEKLYAKDVTIACMQQ